MLPRVIATDLDGTLLRPDGTVAPRTRSALAAMQARGVEIVVCTARPVRWMRGLAQAGGISGTAVCANGAVLWDLASETLISSFPVDRETAEEVVTRLGQIAPGGAWAVEAVDGFGHEPGYRVRWPVPEDAVVDDITRLLSRPPVKLLLRPGAGDAPGESAAPAQAVAFAYRARELVTDLVELTFSDASASLLEMSAAGVSKRSGLHALCAERGIAASEVIAFGDMQNDISMLTWAGRSYAMGNAHPDVAAAADEVTLTNGADGVAVVLERLLTAAGVS